MMQMTNDNLDRFRLRSKGRSASERERHLMRDTVRELTPIVSQSGFRLILTTPFEPEPWDLVGSDVTIAKLKRALCGMRDRFPGHIAEYRALVADELVRADIDVDPVADAWILPEDIADDFIDMRPCYGALPHLRISLHDDRDIECVLAFWNHFARPREWLADALQPIIEKHCSTVSARELNNEVLNPVSRLVDVWTRHLALHERMTIRQANAARDSAEAAYAAIGDLEAILNLNQFGGMSGVD